MIKTQRQYHATQSQRDLLAAALHDAQAIATPDVFRAAHIQALQTDIQTLQHEITLYDRQRNGEFDLSTLQSIATLGQNLIRARIACKLTQKDLAQALGKKEQAIQRLEATDYTTASLATLTTIAETIANHQRTRPIETHPKEHVGCVSEARRITPSRKQPSSGRRPHPLGPEAPDPHP